MVQMWAGFQLMWLSYRTPIPNKTAPISVAVGYDHSCLKYKFHWLLIRPEITNGEVTSRITPFQICPWLVTMLLVLSSRQVAKCVAVLPPCLLVINPHDILQKWRIRRRLANTNRSIAKKPQATTLAAKLAVDRFENGNSKGKIGGDTGLWEATMLALLEKSNEYYKPGEVTSLSFHFNCSRNIKPLMVEME